MVALANNRDSIVDVMCVYCGAYQTIFYNREDMVDWLCGNGNIQDIMPYLSANERELLISNTCGSCFDKMFPPLDNGE